MMIIKRILHSLIIFSSCVMISGQQEMTNIVPPSPQADEMVKYGNQPLNEYRGMAQISIPITEIKEKNIFNNIELKYAKLGVKVNDISNNVGVSWLLEAGGVITRTINDLPDEMQLVSNRLIFNSLSELSEILLTTDNTNNALTLNSYFTDESYDNEIDVFNISVNGLTGRFYLDKNLNPVLLTQNNQFKLETVGIFKNTHEFVLTTVDGVKYYFGGLGAIEKTWKRQNPIYSGVTSFYLTKIINLQGDEINFDYIDLGARSFLLSKYQTKYIESNVISEYHCDNQISHSSGDIDMNNILRLDGAKQLSSISSRDKKIIFNHLNPDNTLNEKLFFIEILSNTNKKNKKIEFEYLDQFSKFNPSVLQRFYLNKIKTYNYDKDNLILDKVFTFTYDDPLALPDKESYSIDVFGYFNDKINSSFLPDLDLLNNKKNFPENYIKGNLADRRSDFDKAKKGTLTSITYPTKGKTVFEYEGLDQKVPIYTTLYGSVYNTEFDVMQQYTSPILNGSDIVDDNLIIELNIQQNNIQSLTSPLEVKLTIFDVTNGSNEISSDVIGLPRTSQEDIDIGYRIKSKNFQFVTEKNKKYIFVLTLIPKQNIHYSGDFKIDYKSGYTKQNISGLRLKKTYDVDESNNIHNIKRLYYSAFKDINNYNILPDNLYYEDYKINSHFGTGCTSDAPLENTPFYRSFKNVFLASEPLNYFRNDEIIPLFTYPVTTISYGGDNFEKGGEEKRFVSNNFDVTSIFKQPQSTYFLGNDQELIDIISTLIKSNRKVTFYDDYNGKIQVSKIFKNKNDNYFLDSKTEYNYNFDLKNTIYDLSSKEGYSLLYTTIPQEKIVSNLFIYSMTKNVYSIFLSKTLNTKYFEDVPMDIEDDSSYKKTITTTQYYYNNPSHYQLTNQKVIFPDSSIQETHYDYAHEKGNTYLTSKNMIGIPLETEVIKKKDSSDSGTTISKSETIYPYSQSEADSKTSGLPLPISVSNLNVQTNAMSTEVIYKKYDDKGNLLQYNLKPNATEDSGNPVAIIWGYNKTQPIAKIEGAAYDQVSGYISEIVDASEKDANPDLYNLTPEQSEQNLIDKLDEFRKKTELSGFQITTYTYDPLIGVKSITPPSGIREVYIYDTANRLQSVKDVEGKILKEYQYNYKH